MKNNSKGLAIAGLVLGILSFFLAWTIIIPLLGIILSSVAIYQGRGNPQSGKGMAIAGLVTSIAGVVILFAFSYFAYASYAPIVAKGYAAEAENYIKDVAGATSTYEQTYGGRTPTIEELKRRGYISPTDALQRNWEIDISGQKISATSTEEMPGGAGNTVEYDRETGEFSGYGFDYDGE